MKCSMREVGKGFSSHRMLKEYSEGFYFPALENSRRLAAEGLAPARDLAAYLEKARAAWPHVAVTDLKTDAMPVMERG